MSAVTCLGCLCQGFWDNGQSGWRGTQRALVIVIDFEMIHQFILVSFWDVLCTILTNLWSSNLSAKRVSWGNNGKFKLGFKSIASAYFLPFSRAPKFSASGTFLKKKHQGLTLESPPSPPPLMPVSPRCRRQRILSETIDASNINEALNPSLSLLIQIKSIL